MRIRTIKPEFWGDKRLATLPLDVRLIFIGLWSAADDEGRGSAEPPRLAADLMPYDLSANPLETLATIRRALESLSGIGRIIIYEVKGERFYEIPNWKKHQKIDKPSKGRVPAPCDKFDEPSASPRETLGEYSSTEQGTGNREKEQGGEGIGKSARAPEPIASRSVEPPPGMPQSEQEAVDIGATAGIPPELCRLKYAEAESVGFVDWKGRPIRNFRSWLVVEKNAKVSREAEKKASPPQNGYPAKNGERRDMSKQQPGETREQYLDRILKESL